MPNNKNALKRIKVLDELLANHYKNHSMDDLVNEINNKLEESFSRRCIEKDIEFIETEFRAEIDKYPMGGAKKGIRYKDKNFSVFKKKMTKEESYLIKEVLQTLGQFDGLPDFEEVAKLANNQYAETLSKENNRQIVAFDKNASSYGTIFAELYASISQKQIINLHYHTFLSNEKKCILFHPYLLKEYNRRWFVFGIADEDDKVLNFALDRIDKVKRLNENKYKEYDNQLDEWFEDIVGVSNNEEDQPIKILFWANDKASNYIKTKPIHPSLKQLKTKDEELRKKYPNFENGNFFSIECKKNYELIRELWSYFEELVVLEPQAIRDEILNKINKITNAYKN